MRFLTARPAFGWVAAGLLLVGVVLAGPPARAADLALVQNGVARCCIVTTPDKGFPEPDHYNWKPRATFLAWAAADLAHYLGRITGAEIPVSDAPITGLVPIYLGHIPAPAPAPATGPAAATTAPARLSRQTEYGDAYALDVSPQRVVLQGESRRAVYYAASQLLADLGVRWYAPGEIGEVVPRRSSVSLPLGRAEYAPDFVTRNIWCRPPDEERWKYRNRLGDATLPSGHALHGFGASLPGWKGGAPERAKHPDFYNVTDGRPGPWINLANPQVAQIFAAHAITLFKEGPRAGAQGGKQARGFISISPDDGYLADERPEVVALNSPGRDPILGMPSFSDAWFGFLNAVCAQVDKQAPGLEFRFGSLAYMNYLLPPRKVKPDPRIVPVVAPIAFNRYVRMGTPGAPTSELLVEILKGWTAASPRVGVYLYNFNLADMAMPYTRRLHWTADIPAIRAMGIRDFTAESHPNWHTMMPGNYIAAQLLWNTKADVNALLDEYYPGYYGPAGQAMREYDTALENAYQSTRLLAGMTWAIHRILTPEVMAGLERSLAQAQAKAKGQGVYERRVQVVRFSLNFAQHWLSAREALHRFEFAQAQEHSEAFLVNYKAGFALYPDFFGKNVPWGPNLERYYELFHARAFREAGRIAREGTILCRLPDEWQACLEPVEGGAKPSGLLPDARAAWRPLKTYSATLDEQGLTYFRGVIWHRHRFTLPAQTPQEAPLKIWFGGLDSKLRLYLNGQDLGEHRSKTFNPVEVDITSAVRRDGPNDLLVGVDNTFPNEIGVGGILRPIVIYTPKR